MQPQQRLGQTFRQAEKHNVLDLLAGVTQASAHHFDQLHRDVGIFANDRDKVAALDHHQLAVLDHHRVGGAGAAIQQRNLA